MFWNYWTWSFTGGFLQHMCNEYLHSDDWVVFIQIIVHGKQSVFLVDPGGWTHWCSGSTFVMKSRKESGACRINWFMEWVVIPGCCTDLLITPYHCFHGRRDDCTWLVVSVGDKGKVFERLRWRGCLTLWAVWVRMWGTHAFSCVSAGIPWGRRLLFNSESSSLVCYNQNVCSTLLMVYFSYQ